MALAERYTTSPSSWKGTTSNIIPFPAQEVRNDLNLLSTTIFNKDNQKPAVDYSLYTSLWLFNSFLHEKPINLPEYKGFNLSECGEITVSYNKNGISLLYNLKFLCLNKHKYNDYYPEPYLIICFELELEGAGNTKEEAFDDLFQLFDLYFNRTREIHENPTDYINTLNENIIQVNSWKQSFLHTYNWAQKLEIINSNYKYQIT